MPDITRRSAEYPGVGGIWPCRDGVIEFIALTDKHWAALMELLGTRPNSAIPPTPTPLAGGSTRKRSWPSSRPPILAMDREDFVGRGQQLGVPCALVNTVGQFAQDPQPRSRGFFVREPLAGLGEFDLPGEPFLSRQPVLAQYRRPAPRLGEHDPAEIAAEWRSAATAAAASRPVRCASIRAISFGTVVAGALSGTALAELGADVVKIESPTVPDTTRRLRPGDRGSTSRPGPKPRRCSPTSTAPSAAWRWT